MKTKIVKIGDVYDCKVGRNIVVVRIERTSPTGGWDATNIKTGKTMAIRDAKRLLKKRQVIAKKATSKQARQKAERMSCLDAATKVLHEEGEAMGCGMMISMMNLKGYWISGGKTPAATLYSAILREIQKKGKESRFCKVARGKFNLNG